MGSGRRRSPRASTPATTTGTCGSGRHDNCCRPPSPGRPRQPGIPRAHDPTRDQLPGRVPPHPLPRPRDLPRAVRPARPTQRSVTAERLLQRPLRRGDLRVDQQRPIPRPVEPRPHSAQVAHRPHADPVEPVPRPDSGDVRRREHPRRPEQRPAAGPAGPAPPPIAVASPSPIDWNACVKQNPNSSGTERNMLRVWQWVVDSPAPVLAGNTLRPLTSPAAAANWVEHPFE